MEKYGVVTDRPDGEKTAAVKLTCPKCGRCVEDILSGGVMKCPECGTEPFEKKS